jgi:hypothetical protein
VTRKLAGAVEWLLMADLDLAKEPIPTSAYQTLSPQCSSEE